ncbi:MAG: helix-turn-helix transcriptional regulator [Syntrophales bacterium]|nr:helix-turn-helix transcriptional regulator [Syntrophales bacterium]
MGKNIFNKDYPAMPKSFGEKLKKHRLDVGLKIKELAVLLNVTESSIINWEKRGITPTKMTSDKIKKFFDKFNE